MELGPDGHVCLLSGLLSTLFSHNDWNIHDGRAQQALTRGPHITHVKNKKTMLIVASELNQIPVFNLRIYFASITYCEQNCVWFKCNAQHCTIARVVMPLFRAQYNQGGKSSQPKGPSLGLHKQICALLAWRHSYCMTPWKGCVHSGYPWERII